MSFLRGNVVATVNLLPVLARIFVVAQKNYQVLEFEVL